MSVFELNIDGLVGPTHHYGGQAFGNEASMRHASQISHPKMAALQGLDKMALLHSLGVKQAFLLPQHRPYMPLLQALGLGDDEQSALEAAYEISPRLLNAIFSAASMWTANAATVTPASDSADGLLHITIANLASHLHRAIESGETLSGLTDILGTVSQIHGPLPWGAHLGDEGAANHMRLARSHAEPGAHIFVYGKSLFNKTHEPVHYPARQTLEASQAIVRNHQLNVPTVFLQQNPHMIDAGVFHNDVIAMSNESVLIMYERAFIEPDAIDRIISVCDFDLNLIMITADELSPADLIDTYFFNSQLVTVPSGSMHMIMPIECQRHSRVQKVVERILAADNPIEQAHYVDCRQSMHNGGGPACLRLRVPLSDEALRRMNQKALVTDERLQQIRDCVDMYYPEKLSVQDFLNPDLRLQCRQAVDALNSLYNTP